ncbi:Uma2 family endonuclease [Azoarcus communis]|uniref:Uma2 family endonuclease n=1 Tax=Parazoarcus communis SWub3 = DSM 12120 TaxID=1121029 RepID=A0A323UX26_9RHOO|nr:Uma2 family endonuclease [Parazoarcus communis]NMG46554.1 Uma2 family endonuclease [Parazoarcus communis]NMG68903.1 Uma2 family endonuclease [Parazoarcus communis SWub3 = DSM 12120]PZA16781.1 Uma2 family endonuclease [Azoarcus communis] [Parazoarcus communis SWub3 = DSM 12120]
MGEALESGLLNRKAYLEWEAGQVEKHEYVAGEVFAMVGARREHVLVAGGLYARLRAQLKGTRCQVFVSDMKLFVAEADAYFYPDVMVSCDEGDRRAELAIEHPCLVVEVLSEGTAEYDRGAKFAAYRKLPALSEYLLVDIGARRLELFRRQADGWLMTESVAGMPPLQLRSVDCTLSVDEAFEDLVD